MQAEKDRKPCVSRSYGGKTSHKLYEPAQEKHNASTSSHSSRSASEAKEMMVMEGGA